MSGKTIEKGFVSLLMLMVITFLSLAGLSGFYRACSQERMIRYEAQRIKTAYLADSGLEWAMASLSKDPSWKGGKISCGGGEIEVVTVRNTKDFLVTSRAEINGTKQGRYGEISVDDGKYVLCGYGELFN